MIRPSLSRRLWQASVLGLGCLICLLGLNMPAGAAPEPIEIAADGAWTWYNDPRAIIVGDLLLVGSVDSGGYSRVDLLDLETRKPLGGRRLSVETQYDDHNNPALLQMDDGRILAAWDRHGGDKYWSWRVGEIDAEAKKIEWGEENRVEVGVGGSYCNLFQLEDEGSRLYNFTRTLNFNPNVTTSDSGPEGLQDPSILFKIGTGRVRPYVKYASNGKDRIDFLLTEGHPRNYPTSIYHAYYQDGKLYRTDGQEIGEMPGADKPDVDPVPPQSATLIYDGSEKRAWVWDIGYRSDGHPHAVFIHSEDDAKGEDLRYHYARWDEEAKKWIDREMAFAGKHLYVPENHYAGGITLDPMNENVVYLSTNVHPETGEADPTGRYQIWRGTTGDEGETWAFEKLTDTPDADNLRPYVPRGHDLDTCVVYFSGTYPTYAKFQTRVMGLFE